MNDSRFLGKRGCETSAAAFLTNESGSALAAPLQQHESAVMQVLDPFDLLPVRQLVTAKGDAKGTFAGKELLDSFSRTESFRFIAHGGGCLIMARNEATLVEAELLLKKACALEMEFGAPFAHIFMDRGTGAMMCPVMFLRIDVPRSFRSTLLSMLEGRSAEVKTLESQRDRIVAQAEMQATRMLGFHRQLIDLTHCSGHVLCWLLRYSPARSE